MSSAPPAVLAFAASDPTGGAGLQADLLTIAAMGCHPLSVLTGLTAQDTEGVAALEPVAPQWIERQADVVLADIPAAAFKLGVLASPANARAVGRVLARHREVPVVLDPVLASGRGDALSAGGILEALRELLPAVALATPNSLEARRLAKLGEDAPLADCARRLLELGCGHVLVTGTHEDTGAEVVNTLYGAGGVVREDRWPRLPGSYHGSGCTLASAIAAAMALGQPLPEAVRSGQAFTWQALERGFRPGRGQFLPSRRALH